jgi:N-carbamoylputrescine amidase
VRIALVQQYAGSDRRENLQRGLDAARLVATGGAQLVAYAELGLEPFYPASPAAGPAPILLAEEIPGPTTEAFCALAKQLGIVVVLNLYERDGERAYDSSPVIDADGRLLGVTRMLHIAEMPSFHEQGYYTPGDRGAPIYDTKAGRVGVAICYDRHYPEVMRSLGLQGAEVVVIPQAGAVGEWPEGLYEAEVRTAAFQNGYWVALVNRVGKEDGLEFAGESFVCDPGGQVVARAPSRQESLLVTDLDLAACARSHARRMFLRDRRPELVASLLGIKG